MPTKAKNWAAWLRGPTSLAQTEPTWETSAVPPTTTNRLTTTLFWFRFRSLWRPPCTDAAGNLSIDLCARDGPTSLVLVILQKWKKNSPTLTTSARLSVLSVACIYCHFGGHVLPLSLSWAPSIACRYGGIGVVVRSLLSVVCVLIILLHYLHPHNSCCLHAVYKWRIRAGEMSSVTTQ